MVDGTLIRPVIDTLYTNHVNRHLQTNAHSVFTELDISSSLQVQSYVAFLRFRLKIVTKKSKN